MKKQKQLVTLKTEKGENFDIKNWDVYPRPQLKRDSFMCLNGEWEFGISESETFPENLSEKIIVPFCPQSVLSGVNRLIEDKFYLFYKRTFTSISPAYYCNNTTLHYFLSFA
jgi:hypothetical protein